MNRCYGWKHGDPVTKESSRREEISRGTAHLSKAKAGHYYMRVRLQGGHENAGCYEWPDGWVLGVGRTAAKCWQCEQLYRTDSLDPDFCPACLRDEQKQHAAPSGIRNFRGYTSGATNGPGVARRHTDDELRAIEAQRAADEKGSIF
jgi:hypothetical protein